MSNLDEGMTPENAPDAFPCPGCGAAPYEPCDPNTCPTYTQGHRDRTFRTTFTTPFDQHADREGQPFTLLWIIDKPDDTHDEEVLPMYRIRFGDGFETDAWPEEVLTAQQP